jgi:probable phosphoglycerate mutase
VSRRRTTIVLVRHGESRNQAEGFYGCHEHCGGLSDLGRRQVEALRDRLVATGELAHATALYSSVIRRAVETAEILAPALQGLDVQQDCAFCELHLGQADGLTVDEFERRYVWPDDGDWSVDLRVVPDGETYREMGERVAAGLDRLLERHRGETVVVACHGGVVMQTMWRWFALEPAGHGRAWFNPANSSMTIWREGESPWRKTAEPIELVTFNDHAHLLAD